MTMKTPRLLVIIGLGILHRPAAFGRFIGRATSANSVKIVQKDWMPKMSMSTGQNNKQNSRKDSFQFETSAPVQRIVDWLEANGVNDFTLKRTHPRTFVNTGIGINMKGSYILSVLTDPNVTFGQYAETGILKNGNLIVDKKFSPDGDCIMRHDSHEQVIEHIKQVLAAAEAGKLENTRDHNF